MRFFDYIKTAFKNLSRQKLRTSLTIVAVVIGTLAVVTLVSLVSGARTAFLAQLEAVGAFTEITVMRETDVEMDMFSGGGGFEAKEDAALITDETVEDVRKIDNVEEISPTISIYPLQNIKMKDGDKRIEAYEFQGIIPNSAGEITLLAGEMFGEDDKNKVVLGIYFANKLGYEDNPEDIVGKTVVFSSYEGFTGGGVDPPEPCREENCSQGPEDMEAQEFEAEVVGVSIVGPNERGIYMSLTWAKEFMIQKRYESDPNDTSSFGPPRMIIVSTNELDKEGYSSLVVRIDDATFADKVSEDISALGYTTLTAKQFIDSFMQVFNIIGYILGIIGGISLFVASIGIVNTMIMSIYERTREIGVMRATGATKGTIRWLFTFEASLLGFWGGVIGVGIGFILTKVGNIVINNFMSNQDFAAENILGLPLWMTLGVVGFTTVIGLLAGIYPASRAARMDPVEALRYE